LTRLVVKKWLDKHPVRGFRMSALRWVNITVCFATALSATGEAQSAPPAVRDGAAGYTVACALVDQPGLRSCADLPAAAACAREPELASQPSTETTGMTFVNRSDRAVTIYWLDFRGARRLYRTLSPGGHLVQQTFIGHNWLVATSDDLCVGIFKAAPESLAFF
jgi:hypothetical protein